MRAAGLDRLRSLKRVHLAETTTAAAYGTILLLVALLVIDEGDVASGSGFALVVEIGLATYVAHVFAHVVGAQLLQVGPRHSGLLRAGLIYSSPILLVTVLPAVALGLGGTEALSNSAALWTAITIALVELLAVGTLAGLLVEPRPKRPWLYTLATAGVGVIVVAIKSVITH